MMIADYEKQVYTAVLGKIIGVYLGRPIEGWSKQQIEETFGTIEGYVHEALKVPLVVADDDISGTFTFIKALRDSGLYETTPADFFGKTWLNYLWENQTVLWWGGMACSTEHTAFLRLKAGIPAPLSGAIATNGKIVAEQIGGQIFIDAFGMVAPGNADLAAKLARQAASVSHDGEAVNAAIVVAAMVSTAFVEKDMEKILDIGVSAIPRDSLIAQVHNDVRNWCRTDGNWNKTYQRIARKYGYDQFGGGCHVIPNHALMVMAWGYAQNDFYEAMKIICSAGWDTDCNAANVGSVTALAAGLEHLCDRYDFRSPFADQVIIPTADPTDSTTDAALIAGQIASIGRKVMGWQEVPLPKNGAWHHFTFPGSLHGYLPDDTNFDSRNNCKISNPKGNGLELEFQCSAGRKARIVTPCCIFQPDPRYAAPGVPTLYPGITVHVKGKPLSIAGQTTAKLFVQTILPDHSLNEKRIYSAEYPLTFGDPFDWKWTIPQWEDEAIARFGIELASDSLSTGILLIDRVELSGKAEVTTSESVPFSTSIRDAIGWISNFDAFRDGFLQNRDIGVAVTGNRSWNDTVLRTKFSVHSADFAGTVLRYQGNERYYALGFSRTHAQICCNFYGWKILAETPFCLENDQFYDLEARCVGNKLQLFLNGELLLECQDNTFSSGGAGFVVNTGRAAARTIAISAQLQP